VIASSKHHEGFEPTYKELKQVNDFGRFESNRRFEPTYKELKLNIFGELHAALLLF